MLDPNDPECLLGVSLGDHLTLNRVLGMGSFAIVYEATSTRNVDTTFAVKALFKQNLTPELLAVQKREGELMKELAHHNIVALYETIETDECLFLVMELCETDLFDLIENLQVDFEVIPFVFDEICSAVAFCHSKGVFHRDLKPENVLVSYDLNSIKLTDFGLATTDAVSNEVGVGSVRYMAPECFDGADYDCAKNDAWALGVILLNLLTGANPWIEPSASTDSYYAEFASLGVESFKRRFGFSDEFLHVLNKIFIDRVDIGEMRKLVAGTQFFFAPITEPEHEEKLGAPTSARTPVSPASGFDWAEDDGEMDYSVPVFETRKPQVTHVTPKLVVEPTLQSAVSEIAPEPELQIVEAPPKVVNFPAPPPPTPVPSRRARQTAAATELIRNTIATLQCFLAGVGENLTFERGVVYVVGG
ncbi:hypothetical protein PhCBS80983_g01059 [Powellomyces hirtus]|uniref:non-specific serine/threonine protein kinase n=1 Tax=Powellomyces hirtus TaxID=109895 RepID=A0A507EE88_9FUNG|nr:hypothetical protein PhCBS80983_g01059 [Powellomyces hirtus]